jgi:hypothetical protein
MPLNILQTSLTKIDQRFECEYRECSPCGYIFREHDALLAIRRWLRNVSDGQERPQILSPLVDPLRAVSFPRSDLRRKIEVLGGKVAMLMIAFRVAQPGGSVATGANGGSAWEIGNRDWKR